MGLNRGGYFAREAQWPGITQTGLKCAIRVVIGVFQDLTGQLVSTVDPEEFHILNYIGYLLVVTIALNCELSIEPPNHCFRLVAEPEAQGCGTI